MAAKYFLAKSWEREANTLMFRGVMPAAAVSYGSLEEALKAIEGLDDTKGVIILKVTIPHVEVKVTVEDESPEGGAEATKKA